MRRHGAGKAPSAKEWTQNQQRLTQLRAGDTFVSWQHVNRHGEFDFSDDAMKDSLRFDV